MSKRRVELEPASETAQISEAFQGAGNVAKVPRTEPQIVTEPEPPPAAPATAGVSVRTSARVLRKKEERKDSESEPASEGNNPDVNGDDEGGAMETNGGTSTSPPVEKPRRTWEQWSAKDKALFFEALNESGKNFCAIETYFQTKIAGAGKKAADVAFKNKEQIRTFYYRTWHKINGYIDFPENVKKSAREIYGLVNYGELRKKAGVSLTMDEKTGARLSELVFSGSTTLRVRGKTLRVRTPICRSLKKLNAKAEATKRSGSTSTTAVPPSPASVSSSRLRIPTAVTLQLKPLYQRDLVRVHGLCMQNPSVHVKVGMQQRMAGLLQYFGKKWDARDKKASQTIVAKNDFDPVPPKEEDTSELWFLTQPGTRLKTPVVTSMEPITHVSLSLSSLQEKLQKKMREKEKSEMAAKAKKTGGSENNGEVETAGEKVKSPLKQEEINDGTKNEDNSKTENGASSSAEADNSKEKKLARHSSAGEWNKQTADQLTIGELYLMLGAKDTEVTLYYTWKPKQADAEEDEIVVKIKELAMNTAASQPMARFARFAGSELGKKQQRKLLLGSPASSKSAAIGVSSSALTRSPVQTTNGFSSPKANGNQGPKAEPGSPLAIPLDASPGRSNGTNGVHETNGVIPTTSAEFRRPNPVPPIRPAPSTITAGPAQAQAFRQQLDQLLPKFSHRRGRPALTRNKTGNTVNRPLQARSVISGKDGKVKLRLLMPGQSLPQPRQLPNQQHQVFQLQQPQQPQQLVPLLDQQQQQPNAIVAINPQQSSDGIPQISIPDASTPIRGQQPLSPTGSFSGLFDSEAYGVGVAKTNGETTPTKGDHFLDSVLENSNSVSSLLQTPPRHRPTPPTSPSRAISDSYLPELSLSSLLSLESPSKGSANSNGGTASSTATASMVTMNEDSIQSNGSEVDRQLINMMNESSVDFSAKFAKLASHVLD